jgi:hypothetical protein
VPEVLAEAAATGRARRLGGQKRRDEHDYRERG